MKDSLKIALIQPDIAWENKEKNYLQYETLINKINTDDHLFILPEMFATGFTMNVKNNAENMHGNTINWMTNISKQKNIAICGSLIIEEKGLYYNRFIFIEKGTITATYDKRHLFRMGEEHLHYHAGENRIIIDYKGWKILPLICYDLRFPVWSRNKWHKNNYDFDLMIYVANWPTPRREAWKTLLKARAIENMAFVAGTNRIGIDGRNLKYSGDSMVIHPKGSELMHITNQESSIHTITLNKIELENLRTDFPVGMDADSFEIKQFI